MAFGFAGAAAGAANSLRDILMRELAAQQEQQQMQLAQQRIDQDAQQFDASMGLQREQLARLTANDQAAQTRQATIDARAASDRSNEQGTRRMIGDFLTQRQPGTALTDQDRGTLETMAVTDDIALPESLTAKPQRKVVTTIGPRGGPMSKSFTEEELAQGVPEYRAPAASSDDLVKVDTMENGKRVTKWLPKSQVAGQTFESPSGGPTLASGQQRRILNFYNRMQDSLSTLDAIEPEIAKQGLMAKAQGQYAPNIMQTPQQQSYRQAQRAFTEARLRKESGAAIPPHEYENDAITYFAQPGDDDATIAQKKAKRSALLESTAFEAGPAYEEFYGEPFKRGGQGGGSVDDALLDELLRGGQ